MREEELPSSEIIREFKDGIAESCKKLIMLIIDNDLLNVDPFRQCSAIISLINLSVISRSLKYTEGASGKFNEALRKTVDIFTKSTGLNHVKNINDITLENLIVTLLEHRKNINEDTADHVEAGFQAATAIAIHTSYMIYNTPRDGVTANTVRIAVDLINNLSQLTMTLLEGYIDMTKEE